MGEMRIMGQRGDTKLIWNPEDRDEVANARRTWDDLVKGKRFLGFRVRNTGDADLLHAVGRGLAELDLRQTRSRAVMLEKKLFYLAVVVDTDYPVDDMEVVNTIEETLNGTVLSSRLVEGEREGAVIDEVVVVEDKSRAIEAFNMGEDT